MNNDNTWLILPVETKVRELHGKLLLSFVAAEAGFNVVIGPKDEINKRARYLPRGFILNFGLAKNFETSSRLYRNYGHKVIAVDEEGLVTLNDEIYLRYRVSEDTLKQTDLFFCWGERQARLVESKAKGTGCRVVSSGNPRFDILRPEYRSILADQVEEIRSKYGPMILINTNFGSYNHINGVEFTIRSLRDKQWMTTVEDERFHMDRISLQGRFFDSFNHMLPVLSSEFRNYNIVLRPHPSENHDIWRRIAGYLPNVHIVHEGSVDPWILASDILIHNGCTTAVQAVVLGKPVIAYRPEVIDCLETRLPNEISEQAYNIDDLVNIIKNILNGSYRTDDSLREKMLADYVTTGNGLASDNIIKALSEENVTGKYNSISGFIPVLKLGGFLNIMRNFASLKIKGNTARRKYIKHKFSGITREEITEMLKFLGTSKRGFKETKISRIGQSCYVITGKG